jgi:hypothetical protein
MKKLLLLVLLSLCSMIGCSSEPPKPAEKPQPKGPEFVTGRTAFQKCYIAARGWARDAQPYRLQSRITSDSQGKDGKSDLWQASFASPSTRGVKPYTWSGTDASDAAARGVNPGNEDNYSPTNSSTTIFDMQFLKVDSDKAFEEAQKHGGDKLLEKASDTPVSYILDWSPATNKLIWHVLYGSNPDTAKLKVDIDATSGEFIRVEK